MHSKENYKKNENTAFRTGDADEKKNRLKQALIIQEGNHKSKGQFQSQQLQEAFLRIFNWSARVFI